MKDSGIEWLGDIPAHWEILPLKFISNDIIDCKNRTPPYYDDGQYLVVRTSNVRNGKLIFEESYYTNKAVFLSWTKRGIPEAGDVLITREAPTGEACIVPEGVSLCLGQRMMMAKLNAAIMNSKFLLFLIYSPIIQTYIIEVSFGSTVSHMRVPHVHNMPCLVPDINEQIEIINFLEEETTSIDNLIANIQNTIDYLQEYRTALISAAVTGQIDVREWTPDE